jgi:hypothetical protein
MSAPLCRCVTLPTLSALTVCFGLIRYTLAEESLDLPIPQHRTQLKFTGQIPMLIIKLN